MYHFASSLSNDFCFEKNTLDRPAPICLNSDLASAEGATMSEARLRKQSGPVQISVM